LGIGWVRRGTVVPQDGVWEGRRQKATVHVIGSAGVSPELGSTKGL